MKALVKTAKGPGLIEVRDVPEPAVRNDDDVLIRVRAAGVCGTDLHIFHDRFTYYPPVILGHEFSGVVAAVGHGVTRWQPGDHVVGEPHAQACGVCELCRQGKVQLCPAKRSPGWGRDGAFADFLVMPEKLLHRIPDNVDDVTAALAEPLAIVVSQVLERGRVEIADTVAIFGAGPIGLLAAFAARAAGAARVFVLGLAADEPVRFPIAKQLGADATVNVQAQDGAEWVRRATAGRGADLVVEASGAEAGIRAAIGAVRKCGRITAIGMTGRDAVSVPWDQAMSQACDVYFNMSSNYTAWDRALALMAATRTDLACLVTHRETIANWQPVFADLEQGRAVKAVFIPESVRAEAQGRKQP